MEILNQVFNTLVGSSVRTKKEIVDFKDLVKSLDDSTFIEIIEKAAEDIDINEFNNLLEKEEYSLQEELTITWLIYKIKKIITKYIDDKIVDLLILRQKL